MARKRLRRVTVDDVMYEWAIRKKPTYVQGAFKTPMTIAIQRVDADVGCVLLVNAGISRPENWIAPHQTSVTPAMVRAMISGALADGWLPLGSGSAFRFNFPLIMDRT